MEARPHPAPVLAQVGPGITSIDTGMAGQRELNSVYLIAAAEPCLIEAGPGSDGPTIVDGLARLDVGPDDLAHVVVTHIHMDHAGGVGALLRRFPKATVWVHERGARHLVDPSRLVASTARTYGQDRMRALYGEMVASDAGRVRSVEDGAVISLGDRALDVVHTPGHASHHVVLLDDATGALFSGEAIGSYLPWSDLYRPALPPPEVDVEQALGSIRSIRARRPTTLLTSHFGPVPEVEASLDAAAAAIVSWSTTVRRHLEARPDADDDHIASALFSLARADLERRGFDLEEEITRYDALGSVTMNAQGLARYWRKRWEAEARADQPS